jgi:hypothetical protein
MTVTFNLEFAVLESHLKVCPQQPELPPGGPALWKWSPVLQVSHALPALHLYDAFHFVTLTRREPLTILYHSTGMDSEVDFILILSSGDFAASCFGFDLLALLTFVLLQDSFFPCLLLCLLFCKFTCCAIGCDVDLPGILHNHTRSVSPQIAHLAHRCPIPTMARCEAGTCLFQAVLHLSESQDAGK